MRTLVVLAASSILFGCSPSQSRDGWERVECVTYKKDYRHNGCGGRLVFNGVTEPAPLSVRSRFYEHVCDSCSQTNRMLDQQWPKIKREWRPVCAGYLSRLP